MKTHYYLCIDLKSFFASVECVLRGLDAMTTPLVVADPDRSDKTICLAITPALKKLGIPNRCRLFEIPEGIRYQIARPQMGKYVEYSARIYGIYLHYVSKEDIHVYSIDEAFLDVTDYLSLYGMTARELGQKIMEDIFQSLGLRATCGIGTNLYLAKIALDITAKNSPDFIGELTEESYKRTLWEHRPLTDFWRIGSGTARTLAGYGIYTMREIARCEEEFLYRLFGIDAELLIDHAHGREPVTIADIKNYKSTTHSLSSGQVLMSDYDFPDGRLIVKEMMDALCLDMVSQKLLTRSITLHVGYSGKYSMKSAHKTASVRSETSSDQILIPLAVRLYDEIVNPSVPIRRIHLTCNHVIPEEYRQCSFFDSSQEEEKTRRVQEAVLSIKEKFGKNAILKGMNLEEKSTAMERNRQIGGHKK